MLIPIVLSPSANQKLPSGLAKISHDEVVLVELQGSLDVDCNHPSERNGKFVGKLKIDEATNKPRLLIGNHLLEGKIQALPKPLAVLLRSGPLPENSAAKKLPLSRSATTREGEEDDQEDEDDDAMRVDPGPDEPGSRRVAVENAGTRTVDIREEPSGGWAVVAIVKKKIIFSKRPMPVMVKK